MIPKVIHYCWFGGAKYSKLNKKCIASWRKLCPDFELRRWDETNFDVNMNAYTQKMFEESKWAFLSDYARLYVVEKYGGVYLDTDVELVRPLDDLMQMSGFFCSENEDFINTGLGFGSCAGNSTLREMMDVYTQYAAENIEPPACPQINTEPFVKRGFSYTGKPVIVDHNVIYPIEYLNPFDNATGELRVTGNTYSIHWYSKSWMSLGTRIRSKLTRPFHKYFGKDCFQNLIRDE